MPVSPPPPLQHLWVDLTPMLPGGANGGAKPFILTLLSELAEQQPQVLFHCTCRPEVLAELAPLMRPNLRFTEEIPAVAAGRWLGSRRLARAGRRWRRRLAGEPVGTAAAALPNRGEGAQLLFCPFGAPLLHQGGLATVSTFYDLQVQAYPEFFPSSTRQERLGHFRQILAKATRIAAISHFSRDEAVAQGADPRRTRAIPIRMARCRQAAPMKTPPLDQKSGGFFLYPANLWHHKNHELLLTAFAMARHQGLPASLMLVCTGDGVDRLGELRTLAKRLGLAEAALLPGFVSQSDLEGLYQHALAMVFPSLYEGFGMPVLEAMARRLPVACSTTTSLAEVSGDATLHFHPGNPQQIADALLQLAENPSLRKELIQRGIQHAQDYSRPATMAEEYWDLFREAYACGPVA